LSVKFSYSGNILCVSEKLKNKDAQAQTEGRLRVFKYLQALERYVEFGSHPISGSKLNGLDSQAEFTEYPYADMTPEQQTEFDSFVLQAENL
jgi:hypothetical protein